MTTINQTPSSGIFGSFDESDERMRAILEGKQEDDNSESIAALSKYIAENIRKRREEDESVISALSERIAALPRGRKREMPDNPYADKEVIEAAKSVQDSEISEWRNQIPWWSKDTDEAIRFRIAAMKVYGSFPEAATRNVGDLGSAFKAVPAAVAGDAISIPARAFQAAIGVKANPEATVFAALRRVLPLGHAIASAQSGNTGPLTDFLSGQRTPLDEYLGRVQKEIPTRELSDSNRQKIAALENVARIGEAIRRSADRSAGERAQEPFTPEWFAYQGGVSAVESLPSLAATVAAGAVGGPPAAIIVGGLASAAHEAAASMKDELDKVRSENPDMPEEEALAIAAGRVATYGLPAGAIEMMAGPQRLVVSAVRKEALKKIAKNPQSFAKWVLRIFGDTSKSSLEEGVEEMMQGTWQELTLGAGKDQRGILDGFVMRRLQEGTLGAVAAIPTGAGAATFKAVVESKEAKKIEEERETQREINNLLMKLEQDRKPTAGGVSPVVEKPTTDEGILASVSKRIAEMGAGEEQPQAVEAQHAKETGRGVDEGRKEEGVQRREAEEVRVRDHEETGLEARETREEGQVDTLSALYESVVGKELTPQRRAQLEELQRFDEINRSAGKKSFAVIDSVVEEADTRYKNPTAGEARKALARSGMSPAEIDALEAEYTNSVFSMKTKSARKLAANIGVVSRGLTKRQLARRIAWRRMRDEALARFPRAAAERAVKKPRAKPVETFLAEQKDVYEAMQREGYSDEQIVSEHEAAIGELMRMRRSDFDAAARSVGVEPRYGRRRVVAGRVALKQLRDRLRAKTPEGAKVEKPGEKAAAPDIKPTTRMEAARSAMRSAGFTEEEVEEAERELAGKYHKGRWKVLRERARELGVQDTGTGRQIAERIVAEEMFRLARRGAPVSPVGTEVREEEKERERGAQEKEQEQKEEVLRRPEERVSPGPTPTTSTPPRPAQSAKAPALVSPTPPAQKVETEGKPPLVNVGAVPQGWPPRSKPISGTVVLGNESKINTKERGKIRVQYAAVESSDLVPSHNPTKHFAKNPDGDKNEIPYEHPREGKTRREEVRDIGADPDVGRLITTVTHASIGPPVVESSLRVIAGNARSMGMQLAYKDSDSEQANRLREGAIREAHNFGLDAERLRSMKNPVIVRIVVGDVGPPGNLSRILNENPQVERGLVTDAVSRGNKITEDVALKISAIVGHERSLRAALSDPADGPAIMEVLVDAGAFSREEYTKYQRPTGGIEQEGKDLIESALLGSAVPDVSRLAATPPSVSEKIAQAIASIIRLRALSNKTGIDIVSHIGNALDIIFEMRDSGAKSVEHVLEQSSIYSQEWRSDIRAIALAKALAGAMGPIKFSAAMRRVADAASEQAEGQMTIMGEIVDAGREFEASFPLELGAIEEGVRKKAEELRETQAERKSAAEQKAAVAEEEKKEEPKKTQPKPKRETKRTTTTAAQKTAKSAFERLVAHTRELAAFLGGKLEITIDIAEAIRDDIDEFYSATPALQGKYAQEPVTPEQIATLTAEIEELRKREAEARRRAENAAKTVGEGEDKVRNSLSIADKIRETIGSLIINHILRSDRAWQAVLEAGKEEDPLEMGKAKEYAADTAKATIVASGVPLSGGALVEASTSVASGLEQALTLAEGNKLPTPIRALAVAYSMATAAVRRAAKEIYANYGIGGKPNLSENEHGWDLSGGRESWRSFVRGVAEKLRGDIEAEYQGRGVKKKVPSVEELASELRKRMTNAGVIHDPVILKQKIERSELESLPHRSRVAKEIRDAFGDEAAKIMPILDAYAMSMAATRGVGIDFYFSGLSIVKGGKPGGDALLQILAFHGGKHLVGPTFASEFIGSGTGALAYGWGFYFSESMAIAEYYKNSLASTTFLYNGEDITEAALVEIVKDEIASVPAPEGQEISAWHERLADTFASEAFLYVRGRSSHNSLLSLINKIVDSYSRGNREIASLLGPRLLHVYSGLSGRPNPTKPVFALKRTRAVLAALQNPEDASLLYDIEARLSFYNTEMFSPDEALGIVRKQLEDTVKARRESLEENKKTARKLSRKEMAELRRLVSSLLSRHVGAKYARMYSSAFLLRFTGSLTTEHPSEWLSRTFSDEKADEIVRDNDYDKAYSLSQPLRVLEDVKKDTKRANDVARMLEIIDKLPVEVYVSKPISHVYEVELDVEKTDLLDWNKSLEEQSDKVKKILEKALRFEPTGRSLEDGPEYDIYLGDRIVLRGVSKDEVSVFRQKTKGGDLYEYLARRSSAGAASYIERSKDASLYLLSLGIPGIQYKADADNVSNFVIFDASLITIKKMYQKSREKNAPIWYSRLRRSVAEKMPNKMDADELRQMLLASGIKKVEMEWAEMHLLMGTVTKQQVLEHLDKWGLSVEHVVLKQDTNEPKVGDFVGISDGKPITISEIRDDGRTVVLSDGTTRTIESAKHLITGYRTEYGKYTLGGEHEDYKEALLFLPSSYRRQPFHDPHFYGITPSLVENVVAHVRFDTRRDSNGNKILFVEEVQSDWSQIGRSKGFAASAYALSEAEKKAASILQDIGENGRREISETNAEVERAVAEAKRKGLSVAEIEEAAEKVRNNVREKYRGIQNALWVSYANAVAEVRALAESMETGVPFTPYQKTQHWTTLALRWVLRYAAENGFHSVAWTTGAMQDERYNIGAGRISSVDVSKWDKEEEYKVLFIAEIRGEKRTISLISDKSEGEIHRKARELYGESIADFVIEAIEKYKIETARGVGEEQRNYRVPDEINVVVGKSLSEYYDSIIPNAARDLIKKHGAAVADIGLEDGQKVRGFVVTDSMRREALEEGFPLLQESAMESIGARGSWEMIGNGRRIIRALTDPNISTPLHEIAHDFLEMLPMMDQDLAERAAQALGATSHAAITEEMHEKWANGFVAYVREGKAPSNALRDAFELLRKWLVDLYRSIVGTPLENSLTPQMRAIFDEMLTKHEAISRAVYEATQFAESQPKTMLQRIESEIRRVSERIKGRNRVLFAGSTLSANPFFDPRHWANVLDMVYWGALQLAKAQAKSVEFVRDSVAKFIEKQIAENPNNPSARALNTEQIVFGVQSMLTEAVRRYAKDDSKDIVQHVEDIYKEASEEVGAEGVAGKKKKKGRMTQIGASIVSMMRSVRESQAIYEIRAAINEIPGLNSEDKRRIESEASKIDDRIARIEKAAAKDRAAAEKIIQRLEERAKKRIEAATEKAKAAKEAVRAEKERAKRIDEIRQRIEKMVVHAFPKDLESRSRFLHAVRTARTERDVAFVATRIYRRQMRNRSKAILVLFRKAVRSVGGWQGFVPEDRMAVRSLLAEAASARKGIIKRGIKIEEMEALLEKMNDALSSLESIVSATLSEHARHATDFLNETRAARDRILKELNSIPPNKRMAVKKWFEDERKDIEATPTKRRTRATAKQLSVRNFFFLLSGWNPKSEFVRNVYRPMRNAKRRLDAANQRTDYERDSILINNFGSIDRALEVLMNPKPTEKVVIDGKERAWTLNDVLALVAHLDAPDNYNTIVVKGNPITLPGKKHEDRFVLSKDEADEILRRYSRYLPLVYNAKEQIERERAAAFAQKWVLTNKYPKMLERYWPIRRFRAEPAEGPVPDSLRRYMVAFAERAGFTKERVGGKKPIVIEGFLQTWTEHVHALHMLTHMAAPFRRAWNIVMRPDVVESISKIHGRQSVEWLRKVMLYMSLINEEEKVKGDALSQIAVISKRFATISALSLNLVSMMTNIGGITRAFGAGLRLKSVYLGSVRKYGMSMKAMADESPYFYQRWYGNPLGRIMLDKTRLVPENSTIHSALRWFWLSIKEISFSRLLSAWEKFQAALMKTYNWSDFLVARLIYSAYRNEVEQQHPTWSVEKKRRFAMRATEEMFSISQNPSDPYDMSIDVHEVRSTFKVLAWQYLGDAYAGHNRVRSAAMMGKKVLVSAIIAELMNISFSLMFRYVWDFLRDWLTDEYHRLTGKQERTLETVRNRSAVLRFLGDISSRFFPSPLLRAPLVIPEFFVPELLGIGPGKMGELVQIPVIQLIDNVRENFERAWRSKGRKAKARAYAKFGTSVFDILGNPLGWPTRQAVKFFFPPVK